MTIASTRKFTIAEYHRLTALGFFEEDDHLELIRGEIVPMAAKGTAHTVCCSALLEALAALLKGKATLRCQDPITLPSGSEPEPDFVVARLRVDRYLAAHPAPSDILLVIEIADSSLESDRTVKRSLYAEAGIADYWIFNLLEQQLEAHSEPFQNRQQFDYAARRIFLPDRTIVLPNFPELDLPLSQIFSIGQ